MILFLSFILSSAQAGVGESYSTTYSKVALAIAGQGPGTGLFGHSFILFYNSHLKLSESEAFAFTVENEELPEGGRGFLFEAIAFFGFGKNFTIEHTNGLTVAHRYSQENRIVLLYELKLSLDEQKALRSRLLVEEQRRNDRKIKDYNFLQKNCVTEALKMIADSLPAKDPRRPSFLPNSFLSGVSNLFLLGRNVGNAPLVAARQMENHPAVSKIHILSPDFLKKAQIYLSMFSDFKAIGRHVDSETEFEQLGQRILARDTMIYQPRFLDFVLRVCRRKPGPEILKLCGHFYESLYLSSTDIERQMLVESYEEKLRE